MGVQKLFSSPYIGLFTMFFYKEAKLMVVSEQEGAEIIIDGRSTGLVTPALLSLNLDTEVHLCLKLTAHKNYNAYIRLSSPLSYHYCSLERTPWTVYQGEAEPISYLPPPA